MTVKELGDLIIWIGAVLTAMLGIGVVLRIVVVNPLKRNITKELESVHEKTDKVLAEIAPVDGVRIGERIARLELRCNNVEQRINYLEQRSLNGVPVHTQSSEL